jgi:hypothetical protein
MTKITIGLKVSPEFKDIIKIYRLNRHSSAMSHKFFRQFWQFKIHKQSMAATLLWATADLG